MTIDQTNIGIYKSLYQHKALTERIIGFTDYALQYAVASYKAVCTEGVDFTMFDKVVCGILQVDEVSGFEAIADILGLNVVHSPEEGKYIDFGEKEILEYAIKSLIDFNMVETDDIYYSRIRLTEIGKDYAKQGKKFLPATPKEFKIYFDLTDQKHQEAKKRFGRLMGVKQASSLDFEINDEVLVKEIAKIQTPEIYNPDQLRNFTGLELRGTEVFQVNFKVVGLVSIKDNSVRLLVYDDKQNISQSIIELIEDNSTIKNELYSNLINQFEPSKAKIKSSFQRQHETAIKAKQQDVEDLLSQKQDEKAFAKLKEAYLKSNIIEAPYFELNFKDFFDEKSKEFWIILSGLSQHLFNEIKEIIERKAKIENNIFIIAQSNVLQEASQYFNEMAMNKPNVFWGAAEKIEETIILSKNGNDKNTISRQSILVGSRTENGLIFFEQAAYFQIKEWSSDVSEIYRQCKNSIAKFYCQNVSDKVEQGISDFMKDPKSLTKPEIEALETLNRRLRVFRNDKEVSQWINDFHKSSKEKFTGLKELLASKVQSELNDIEPQILDEEANYSISELRVFEDRLQELRTNLYDENTEEDIKVKVLEDFIKPKIQALSKLEKKPMPRPQNQKTNSFTKKR